jgi:hypothetical protein
MLSAGACLRAPALAPALGESLPAPACGVEVLEDALDVAAAARFAGAFAGARAAAAWPPVWLGGGGVVGDFVSMRVREAFAAVFSVFFVLRVIDNLLSVLIIRVFLPRWRNW